MTTEDSPAETQARSEGVAVVTGAAHGLGTAIAKRLHRDGHTVVIADIDEADANAVARELDPSAHTARGYGVDVTDHARVADLLDYAVTLGPVRVLVNNAARTQARPLLDITPDELADVMSVNFHGVFYTCQVFGAYMSGEGYGRIINMASLAGQSGGTATGGHYASSKGAILSATKVFARELASSGVTVNAVSPGPLETPNVRSLIGAGNLDSFTKNIPVGRLGDPAFIADMVALIASRNAASVTGACWDANGGLYLR
ncbi:3-oxoacyl-ACP reductase [Nocardia nova]|uniref:3-oxoacyl-ACP reductase n=1 Tax=Nocardia nova TaxID=37330 RepID=A0A2S6AKJ8_9NOCA|nr:SDR family oxidoreductase [Nocardia nova]PPJ22286.1 3-oxoacyl-ACP reductase [Nocardia nova]PPJ35748.1 3-oxoacyl-ACP reductase [Nocardia nova]